jgi:hypothetical protein
MDANQKHITIACRKFWYNRVYVDLEFIKTLKNRELCLLSSKEDKESKIKYRQLLCQTYNIWKIIRESLKFDESLVNLYHSVATFSHIPVSTFDRMARIESPEYMDFNENYDKYMTGYDFLVDLDGKDFIDAYNQAKKVKFLFDKYKLGYYMVNSSLTGFHLVVPNEYTDDSISVVSKNIAFGNLASWIQDKYQLEGLDKSIYDARRVKKVPYSYNCGDDSIVLPLDDKNFNEDLVVHQHKFLKYSHVKSLIHIMNRGLLTRTWGLTKEQLQDNFRKFRKEMS